MADPDLMRPRVDAIVFCNEIRPSPGGDYFDFGGVVSQMLVKTPVTGPFCFYIAVSGARKDTELFFEFTVTGEAIDAPEQRLAHGPIHIRAHGRKPNPNVAGECAMQIPAVHFPIPGDYRFRVKHNGDSIAERVLPVYQAT